MVLAAFLIASTITLSADMGTLVTNSARPWVQLMQLQFLTFLASYAPQAVVGVIVLRKWGRRHDVKVWPAPAAASSHTLRFVLAFSASLLFNVASTLLKSRNMPVSGTALLGSGAAVGTTFLVLLIELHHKRKAGRKPRSDRWAGKAAALFAVLALAGVVVGIAGRRGIGGVFNFPIFLGAVGAVMLSVLGLMPKLVLAREAGEPVHGMAAGKKLLLTLKIVTLGACGTSVASAVGMAVTVSMIGLPHLPAKAGWLALGLCLCAVSSQLLVQYGNGFGNPAYVNPLLTWTVPFSFAIDRIGGHEGDLAMQAACFVLVALGTVGLTWLAQREKPGPGSETP